MKRLNNASGFALIEVLIAMVVFAIGVMALGQLQYRAVGQNQVAFDRTGANAVARAVLEELKRLPFDDVNLTNGAGDLNAGMAPPGGDPTPGDADHLFVLANLPALQDTIAVDPTDPMRVIGADGRLYRLFWNVVQTNVVVGTDNVTPFATIRLFIYWDTRFGRHHLEMTTVKSNNLDVV